MAGFKRDRCVNRCKLGCYVRREVLGLGGGIVLPPPSPKVPSHGRQSDSLLCQTGSMEAALQLRRAAVSLGRGVVAHVRYVIL